MKTKKSRLDRAVKKTAKMLEAHMSSLTAPQAKAMRRDIHALAVKSSRRANRGKSSPSRRTANQMCIRDRIQPLQNPLIRRIPATMPETHQVQRSRRHQLPSVIRAHPFREFLRQIDVSLHVIAQPFHPVMPDHEPKFQRTKPPPQRNLPVPVCLLYTSRCV